MARGAIATGGVGRIARPGVERLEPRWLLSLTTEDPGTWPRPAAVGVQAASAPAAEIQGTSATAWTMALSPLDRGGAERLQPVAWQAVPVTLSLEAPDDLYALPILPETDSIKIRLFRPDPNATLDATLTVYDDDGQPAGFEQPIPGTLSLETEWPTPPVEGRGRPLRLLYLRVGLHPRPIAEPDGQRFNPSKEFPGSPGAEAGNMEPDPGGKAAKSFPYQLEVSQLPESRPASGEADEPDTLGYSKPGPAPSSPPPDDAATTTVRKPPDPPSLDRSWWPSQPSPNVLDRLATGPLPLLSAVPMGGMIVRETTPTVADPRNPATFDKVLREPGRQPTAEVPLAQPMSGSVAEPNPSRDARVDKVLEEVAAGGGLPWLGTAAGPNLDGETESLPTLAELARHAEPQTPAPPDPVKMATPVAPSQATTAENSRSSSDRSRLVRRLSIATAVSMALLATLGLDLPGLVDPYGDGGRLRRVRRRLIKED